MQKKTRTKQIAAIIIALMQAALMLSAGILADRDRLATSDYSSDWLTDRGEIVRLDDLNTSDYGGSVSVVKKLPADLGRNDALCFISNNSSIEINVDGKLIYEYTQGPNFTGRGYGTAYHTVGLHEEWKGSEVKITVTGVFRDGRGGYIRKLSVEEAGAYRGRIVLGLLIPLIISFSIMLIGIDLLFIRAVFPRTKGQPDLIALAITAILNGIWLANDTGFFRLTLNAVIFSRVTDFILMHAWVLPLQLFIYSATHERKRKFKVIAIGLAMLDAAIFIGARFALGTDMSALTEFLVAYYVCAVALIAAMLVSNRNYCREIGVEYKRPFFYSATIALVVSGFTDLLIFASGVRSVTGRADFVRLGFCIFFLLVAIETIRVISNAQTSARREQFINKMLQYAVSANDPDDSIKAIMEYFGKEFGVPHGYIFENQRNGNFHNTYEWFAEGAYIPEDTSYHDVPFEGMIDGLYEIFDKEHRLIVEYSEETKALNKRLYEIMTNNRINRMVLGPLEYKGELIGFLGLDDAPEENCKEIANITWLASYFITQLIMQRNEKRELIRNSQYDSLTGAKNRRALDEFEAEQGDIHPYGLVMCDINGLKRVNDSEGHEAGDALIIDVANALTEAFGSEYVFRLGGDEFAIYSFAGTEEEFKDQVGLARAAIKRRGRSASMGAVYVTDDSQKREEVRAAADALMYREKEEYYKGRNDRRIWGQAPN